MEIRRTIKKALSVTLAIAMVLTTFFFTDLGLKLGLGTDAKAYSSYSQTWAKEYNYPSGQKFVKNIGLYWSTSTGAAARSGITDNGMVLAGGPDLQSGVSGIWIYYGYTQTTDPTASNCCRGIRISHDEAGQAANVVYANGSDSDGNGAGTHTYTSNVVWYKCNSGYNSTYSPALTGDGAVDLNKGKSGSDDMKMFATYDRAFGPAISDTHCTENNREEGGTTAARTTPGWTDVIDFPTGTIRDVNQGCGSSSDDLYLHFYTPCTLVTTSTLRSKYSTGVTYYNNRTRYTSGS
ncbi:MAG: hypothetical protein K6F09_03015, partial [Clostridiales bacterium]|nr:hypothetical protein [Clostridiales bacterium]